MNKIDTIDLQLKTLKETYKEKYQVADAKKKEFLETHTNKFNEQFNTTVWLKDVRVNFWREKEYDFEFDYKKDATDFNSTILTLSICETKMSWYSSSTKSTDDSFNTTLGYIASVGTVAHVVKTRQDELTEWVGAATQDYIKRVEPLTNEVLSISSLIDALEKEKRDIQCRTVRLERLTKLKEGKVFYLKERWRVSRTWAFSFIKVKSMTDKTMVLLDDYNNEKRVKIDDVLMVINNYENVYKYEYDFNWDKNDKRIDSYVKILKGQWDNETFESIEMNEADWKEERRNA